MDRCWHSKILDLENLANAVYQKLQISQDENVIICQLHLEVYLFY